MGFASERVQEVERHGVDFVVDVETFDVFSVILHDDVDKVVNGDIFVAHENFAIEDLVVAEDVVDHFLIEVFGW